MTDGRVQRRVARVPSWIMLTLGCALFFACTTSTGSRNVDSHDAVVLLNEEPGNLNPILAGDYAANLVDGMLFSLLTTMNSKGEIIPDLAIAVPSIRNHGISSDGRVIVYHLRRDVFWHDGTPLTSRDVAFTWHAIMNARNNVVSRHGYNEVTAVETPDAHTVVFRLREPYAPAITQLFGEGLQPLRILPAHLLSNAAELNDAQFNSLPIGTGPFAFVKWDRGNAIVLRANLGYYRGKPRIRTLRLLMVPSAQTEEDLLRTGQADLATEISPQIYSAMRSSAAVRLYDPPVPSYEAIEINDRRAPLNSREVRRAISYAIDRARIEATVEHGESRYASGPIDSTSWAYDGSSARYQYNPGLANRILDGLGLMRGNDGVRTLNGAPMRLSFAFGSGSPSASALAIQVQSMLQRVGISVDLTPYAFELLYGSYAQGGIFARGNFDLGLFDTTTGPDPDDAVSMFTCAAIPPNGINFARYCSRQFDTAVTTALRSMDRRGRRTNYATAQRILAEDEPVVFLFWLNQLYAGSRRFAGFSPNPFTESWNAYQWHLTARRK